MEEATRYIIDEAIKENEQDGQFTIDSDQKAEWAINKIRAEKAELNRMEMVCKDMITQYQCRIEKAKGEYENNTSWLTVQLMRYFETVPKKETKTQKSYKLPSGTLKLKFQSPEYIKDEEKLLAWVKNNGHTDFVESIESIKWGEFKKTLQTRTESEVNEDGEITGEKKYVVDSKGIKVGGITLAERNPKFEVEV